jgi:hypothetical protein
LEVKFFWRRSSLKLGADLGFDERVVPAKSVDARLNCEHCEISGVE